MSFLMSSRYITFLQTSMTNCNLRSMFSKIQSTSISEIRIFIALKAIWCDSVHMQDYKQLVKDILVRLRTRLKNCELLP